jgi:hypothetical protein
MRDPRELRRVRRARWTAAGALLYLLGLLAQSLHFAHVRHQVCEHGELVHAGAHSGSAAQGHAGAHDEDGSPQVSGEGGEAEAHHHCPQATPASTAGLRVAAGLEVAPCAAPARQCLAPDRPRPPAFARFLLAPHHSPPPA